MRRDRKTGGGGEVTWIISDLAAGPNGGRGRTLRASKGGASQEEDQAQSGRQVPLQGIPQGRPYEETPEVLASDGGFPQDWVVPEKYRAPHMQVPLCEIRMQNCPRYRTI